MQLPKSDSLITILLDALKKKKLYVLATVTGSVGSTPQIPGSSALFSKSRLIAGTIGGGATEMAVGKIAQKAITSKKSGYYRFDLNNDISDFESPICGGGMNILVDASPEKHLAVYEELTHSLSIRIPGVLITVCNFETDKISEIERFWITKDDSGKTESKIQKNIIDVAIEMVNHCKPGEFREIKFADSSENEKKIIFLETWVPLPELIIAGAGHVGKALSHLAKLIDFEVTVWDDRLEYANKTNLPDADKILTGTLNLCFENLKPSRDTFIVIVTRGHKHDADVLKKFIGSEAGYIGMIGSRRKIAQVRELFISEGLATPEQWEKIYTPVGLEIGSKTVQEIAVSIAAQLIQVRSQMRYQ